MGGLFTSDQDLSTIDYTCGWCGRQVASSNGWMAENEDWARGGVVERWFYLVICPNCRNPTYLRGEEQYPGVATGDPVDHLPVDVGALYNEARSAASNGNYTAAVLTGRKVLMHVAVEKGATANETFGHYVGWLAENGIVTADMTGWIDEIRELGNDANHEIQLMGKEEADELLTFVAMLLKVVYEYPERARRSVAAREARDEPGGSGAEEDEDASEGESTQPDFDGGVRPPPTLGS